jgi:hypothetical protein
LNSKITGAFNGNVEIVVRWHQRALGTIQLGAVQYAIVINVLVQRGKAGVVGSGQDRAEIVVARSKTGGTYVG